MFCPCLNHTEVLVEKETDVLCHAEADIGVAKLSDFSEAVVKDSPRAVVKFNEPQNIDDVQNKTVTIGPESLVEAEVDPGSESRLSSSGRIISNEKQTIVRRSTWEAVALMESLGESEPRSSTKSSKSSQSKKSLFPSAFGPSELRENSSLVVSEEKFQDHFVLHTLIGNGSFGTVYQGKEKTGKCDKTFAVKVVKIEDVEAKGQGNMFEAEINISKMLAHPNISWTHRVFRESDKIYFVMDLHTGGDFFDVVSKKAGTGFPPKEAARYIWQMLSGVAYCHRNRVCHRDIKPENYLLDSKRPNAQLKLIDFGLSRLYEKGEPMHSKVGSLLYVAPEVLLGPYTEKCDVWSIGVCAFIVTCGYAPIFEAGDRALAQAVKKCEVRWKYVSKSNENLVKILHEVLVKNPGERPAAAKFADHAWLRGNAREHGNGDCCTIQ